VENVKIKETQGSSVHFSPFATLFVVELGDADNLLLADLFTENPIGPHSGAILAEAIGNGLREMTVQMQERCPGDVQEG